MSHDIIDQIVEQWKSENPQLDPLPMATVTRIINLANLLTKHSDDVLKNHGLSLWGFDVLATLRRQGKPYQLSPTILSQQVMLSTGAMTNRIDRLQQRGLVNRVPDPGDRRSLLIQLTNDGEVLIDGAVEDRMKACHELFDTMDEKEKALFSELLKKLYSSVDVSDESIRH